MDHAVSQQQLLVLLDHCTNVDFQYPFLAQFSCSAINGLKQYLSHKIGNKTLVCEIQCQCIDENACRKLSEFSIRFLRQYSRDLAVTKGVTPGFRETELSFKNQNPLMKKYKRPWPMPSQTFHCKAESTDQVNKRNSRDLTFKLCG